MKNIKFKKLILNNEDETFLFAEEIARNLKGGEIICLKGDLGAGKTSFTKGIARALQIKKNISSPTFVIMKVYPVTKHKKIKQLCHIDAYRVGGDDLEAIGVKEYFNNPDVVSVVEWPENVEGFLENFLNVLEIEIKYFDFDKREINKIKGNFFPL